MNLMDLFRIRRKLSEIDSFIKSLKEIGIRVVVLDEGKIKKRFGEKLSERLAKLADFLYDIDFDKFSIIDEEAELMSWYSDSGRVVLNLAVLNLNNSAHKKKVEEVVKEARRIESIMRELGSL